MLTPLTFLEWLEGRAGEPIGDVLESFTAPSAVLFAEEREPTSGIFSRAAANCDNWRSCDSWLEPCPLLAAPWLADLSTIGGVKTRLDSVDVEDRTVAWESLLEDICFCNG